MQSTDGLAPLALEILPHIFLRFQRERALIERVTHARWVVEMGSQAYGTPTIHQGRVIIGTNNEKPRLDTTIGDRGVVMAFDEQTGDFQWQLAIPKLGAGKVSDWEFLGICSSTYQDGKHGYVV